jgi:hypothetical protein
MNVRIYSTFYCSPNIFEYEYIHWELFKYPNIFDYSLCSGGLPSCSGSSLSRFPVLPPGMPMLLGSSIAPHLSTTHPLSSHKPPTTHNQTLVTILSPVQQWQAQVSYPVLTACSYCRMLIQLTVSLFSLVLGISLASNCILYFRICALLNPIGKLSNEYSNIFKNFHSKKISATSKI